MKFGVFSGLPKQNILQARGFYVAIFKSILDMQVKNAARFLFFLFLRSGATKGMFNSSKPYLGQGGRGVALKKGSSSATQNTLFVGDSFCGDFSGT